MNVFFSSKGNNYYDYLSEKKAVNLFDFIANDADKKLIIENYKKFNQEHKQEEEGHK